MAKSSHFVLILSSEALCASITSMVKVYVTENKADQALRLFKRRVLQEGILKAFKMHQVYEKPSEKRARQKAEAIKRARKLSFKNGV